MWLTKDDDGTICLHTEFPRKVVINDYVSYTSPNMLILDNCNINVDGAPIEVDLIQI